MLVQLGSRTAAARKSGHGAAVVVVHSRGYAQPASAGGGAAPPPPPPSPPPPPPSSSSASSQWKAPAPGLATASTLTLFSASPNALVVALRSTLAGMLAIHNRASSPSSSVLVYALSKSLPTPLRTLALEVLNGQPGHGTDADGIIRLGTLASAIPLGLLPQHAVSSAGGISDPDTPLHAVALSLLPVSHATAFRSTLKGKAKIQVGRWPQQKERWHATPSWDTPSSQEGADQGLPWKQLWGKANAQVQLPESISNIPASAHLSTLLFTDPAPHGILEGLDAHFTGSSLLGLIAPPTPFESEGKLDQTLLYSNGKAQQDQEGTDHVVDAFAQGAVGVVLHRPLDSSSPGSGQDEAETRRPALDRPFPSGLVSLPIVAHGHARGSSSGTSSSSSGAKRHRITRARGNIISQLDGTNAAQVFLADLHARTKSQVTSPQEPRGEADEREMARGARKEEDFYVGIFRLADVVEGEEPLLLVPLLSGAPSRGTLSLDSDTVELGPGPGVFPSSPSSSSAASEDGGAGGPGLYVQFFYRHPSHIRPTGTTSTASGSASASALTPISIPGPDPSVWAMPRFLFLTLPSGWGDLGAAPESAIEDGPVAEVGAQDRQRTQQTDEKATPQAKTKAKVMALPNLFVAASERGWVGKDASVGQEPSSSTSASSPLFTSSNPGSEGTTSEPEAAAAAAANATSVPSRLAAQTQWGNVPFTTAVLNLRSRPSRTTDNKK